MTREAFGITRGEFGMTRLDITIDKNFQLDLSLALEQQIDTRRETAYEHIWLGPDGLLVGRKAG